MKIKTLIDFLNKDAGQSPHADERKGGGPNAQSWYDENVVYIENARMEGHGEQLGAGHELLSGGTQWANQSMGDLLVSQGKLSSVDVERILDYQRNNGVYFGEAAVALKLASQDDIMRALSLQFGYPCGHSDDSSPKEMVMANAPFSEVAEEFRSIRGKLLHNWLNPSQKTLAIVSPESRDGRSYVAANLALAFSQLGQATLLIDGDLRGPRQHEIFNLTRRVGLSVLLAGRVRMQDLDMLPDRNAASPQLSVLGCGAIPPNPAELLSHTRFSAILRELEKFFDVIIIDCPAATYQSDVMAITAVAGSALIVTRSGHSTIEDTKSLTSILAQSNANVVGAVLNEY